MFCFVFFIGALSDTLTKEVLHITEAVVHNICHSQRAFDHTFHIAKYPRSSKKLVCSLLQFIYCVTVNPPLHVVCWY